MLLILSSSSNLLHSQENWNEKIDSLIEKNMLEHNIKGLSIGIVFNDKIQYAKGFGKLNEKSNDSITAETPFLSASISKVFVATAIMQLQEQNLLNIDEKLIRYVPEFRMKDTNYKEITIKQLLNHTSGLKEGSRYTWDRKKNTGSDIKNFCHSLKNKKLLFEPGEKFSYSNTGYVVLGYIIEKLSNQSFDNYIEENILNPLGMTNSNFDINYYDESRFPYYYSAKGKVKKCCIANTSPSGNLISSSTDLSKWILFNLRLYNKSLPNDSLALSRQSQTLLWTPTQTFKGSQTTLGLGWWQYDSEEFGKSVFHAGHYENYSVSNLVIFPERNYGFVLLCNDESAKEVVYNQLSDGISHILELR